MKPFNFKLPGYYYNNDDYVSIKKLNKALHNDKKRGAMYYKWCKTSQINKY